KVTVTGVDSAVIENIKNQINLTATHNTTQTSIAAVSDASLTNNTLGINLPTNLNGVDVKYSHGEINADGTYDVTLNLSKNNLTDSLVVKVTVTGVDSAVIENIKNQINLTATHKTTQTSIAAVTDAPFRSGDLGITLPTNLNGVDVKYSHGSITTDGNYEIILVLSRNSTTSKPIKIQVDISGIEDAIKEENKVIAREIYQNIADAAMKTSITNPDDYYNDAEIKYYTKYDDSSSAKIDSIIGFSLKDIYNNLKPGWEIQIGKGWRFKYKLWIRVVKNGNLYDIDGKIFDPRYADGTQDIDINWIIKTREKKILDKNDVDTIANAINSTATYNSINGAISAVKNASLSKGTLGINLPNDLLDTKILYSHDEIDSNGDLNVKITVSKGFGNSTTKTVKVNVTGINSNSPIFRVKPDAKIGSRKLKTYDKPNSYYISLYNNTSIDEKMLMDLFESPKNGVTISSNLASNPLDSSNTSSIQTITLTAQNSTNQKSSVNINIKFMSESDIAKDLFEQIENELHNTKLTLAYVYNKISDDIPYYTKFDNSSKDLINSSLGVNMENVYNNLANNWEIYFGKNTYGSNSPDSIYVKIQHNNKSFNLDGTIWTGNQNDSPRFNFSEIIRKVKYEKLFLN
ncbi:MAG: hypothetical protein HRT99_00765, partial [Mycoplasmatales bacterium]|nr:hypothetical protein [Mycoplasmatales bacterium]